MDYALYGVVKIEAKGDKVFVSLSYSPKATTLKKKFGILPVRYMRVKINTEEEFKIMEAVVKRYRLNLVNENLEAAYRTVKATGKRKMLVSHLDDTVDDDEDEEEIGVDGGGSADGDGGDR